MFMTAWCLITLVIAALLLGSSFARVLEIGPMRRYGGPQWLELQHSLYPSYAAAAGIIEPAAIIAAAMLAVVLRDWRPALLVAIAGAVCLAIAFAFVSLPVTNRINARISRWTADALPPNWELWRTRLEVSQVLRFILHLAGFALLVVATLVSPLSDE